MKLNKKATALTNPYILLSILLFVGIFSYAIVNLGVDLLTSNQSNLNNESKDFIIKESGATFKINNKSVNNDEFITTNQFNNKWFAEENQTRDLTQDFSLEFFFGLDSVSEIWNTIKSVYNLPAFFLKWLPFDFDEFRFIVNVINLFFWLVLAGVVIYIVRGFDIGK